MKGGLPYLYNLILFYCKKISSDTSFDSDTAKFLDSASTIILNIGNIFHLLSVSGRIKFFFKIKKYLILKYIFLYIYI